jgi:hypothetical protein
MPEMRARIDMLISGFDHYVGVYDTTVPFSGRQFELHRMTIERRRAVGSVQEAVHDDSFTDLLHATLRSWRIGQRASRLAPLAEFRSRLQERASELRELEHLQLERLPLAVQATTTLAIDRLISELGVVDNRARIVAGTKTLHHLLPDLVPPMDRAWTGAFFGWSLLDPQKNQSTILGEAYEAFAEIARTERPSRLVGEGWRTSSTKVIDNAVIGYCKVNGIGGAS